MGLHYRKVDAALCAEIDPTTRLACLRYTFPTEGKLKGFPAEPHLKTQPGFLRQCHIAY